MGTTNDKSGIEWSSVLSEMSEQSASVRETGRIRGALSMDTTLYFAMDRFNVEVSGIRH